MAKKLRLESLEDRRMLAVMLVTDLGDDSLANLAGDGELSLREAIEAVNTGAPVDGIGSTSGQFGLNDAIVFESALFGGTSKTLVLSAGQIDLQSSVILLGPSDKLLTIDAQLKSRIFDITAASGNFTLAQMTLKGGLTNALSQSGGAVRSMTAGSLLISNSTITASAVAGGFSKGGGIFVSGPLQVVNSSITDNFTVQVGGDGGGVFAEGNVTFTNSTVSGNRTLGSFAIGGGVNAGGDVTLHRSTVSGNRTLGATSSAGGIVAVGNLALTESTISGNETEGSNASGAGVISSGTVTVTRSTIVNNKALGENTTGGGVRTAESDITVTGSIIANNSATSGNADIHPGTGTLTVGHSLIGDATGLGIAAATNLLNTDPLLGPLAGAGLTRTHAPLAGSPVIDAGDPFIVLPPVFDQRGAPFLRVADGDDNGSSVIDMGSYEVQSADFLTADFDGDGDADGADFLAWQRGFGKNTEVLPSDGDADSDGDVDAQDLNTWEAQFGGVASLANASAPLLQPTTIAAHANLIDLAIAAELGSVEAIDAEGTDAEGANLLPAIFAPESSSQEQAFAAIASGTQAVIADVEILANAKASQTADEGLVDELVSTSL